MTLSITGRCNRTGQVGIALSSYDCNFGPGPHSLAQHGIGAVAGQANTPRGVAERVLAYLWDGLGPARALAQALAEEGEVERERAQVAVVDAKGRSAAFTGERTMEWRGHRTGQGWAAAGNILAGEGVLAAMGEAFEANAGPPLDERLLGALEAGIAAGGDRRGQRGAFLRVTTGEPATELEIRVHEHAQPVAEVRRLLQVYRRQSDFFSAGIAAAAAIRAVLTDADVEAFAGLATYAAVERIRSLLVDRDAGADALAKVDGLLAAFPLRPDFAEQRFGDLIRVLPT
jgi:uncharacterized Ntn-hydrolase superfamily protein